MNLFRLFLVITVSSTVAALAQQQAETKTEKTTTTTTTTVVTETVVREKAAWSPLKVCVLDFMSIDIIGQQRLLAGQNAPIAIPPQCTLNDRDRQSVSAFMQGFVRLVDARDASATNTANRAAQTDDNQFNRAKALELYDAIVKNPSRTMVIGADYLAAYLGRHGDVFSCVDAAAFAAAMKKEKAETDFPKDFMLRLAKATGATHLINTTVSDVSSTTKSFKGYGIETKSQIYKLDLIVKVVDLVAQGTVYSNVYSGILRQDIRPGGQTVDNNLYQTLLTNAIQEAAEDLYDVCKPGCRNKITPTPLPQTN